MKQFEEKIIEAKKNGFNIKEKHCDIGVSQLDVHYDYLAIINDPDFWKAIYVSQKEDIIKGLPLEQIHQLPDDVGSPHETEYDRGWNEYRRTVINNLNG